MVAMNWRLFAGQWTEQAVIIAVFSVPGLVLLVAWLVRLVHSSQAARAHREPVEITPCLAMGRVPAGGMCRQEPALPAGGLGALGITAAGPGTG
jgi:hypothetical protein